jgi:hypothetical protein
LCRRARASESGAAGDIGLTGGWTRPGCRVPSGGELPPVRFGGPILIANAVSEEYVLVRAEGCRVERQAVAKEGDRQIDVLKVTCDGQAAERKFDIARFFGEAFLSMK